MQVRYWGFSPYQCQWYDVIFIQAAEILRREKLQNLNLLIFKKLIFIGA